jgi:hypothetical protein
MASALISAPEVAKDLQIEQWVQRQYGFVPHPYWISHCRELYIEGTEPSEQNRRPWHLCPPDKRLVIKEAFLHFGIIDPFQTEILDTDCPVRLTLTLHPVQRPGITILGIRRLRMSMIHGHHPEWQGYVSVGSILAALAVLALTFLKSCADTVTNLPTKPF